MTKGQKKKKKKRQEIMKYIQIVVNSVGSGVVLAWPEL